MSERTTHTTGRRMSTEEESMTDYPNYPATVDFVEETIRLEGENETLKHQLKTTQARLDELLRSANIWRAWWNGKGGEPAINLVEKIDLINALEAGS